MSQREDKSENVTVESASILPALVVVAIGAGIVYFSRSRISSKKGPSLSPVHTNSQSPMYASGPTTPSTTQLTSSINALLEERFK
jgi:hypothetical protein